MDTTTGYRASVRLSTGLFSSQQATLTLSKGRLTLVRGGEPVFDLPVASIDEVKGPSLFRRGDLQVIAGGQTYRLSFPSMSGVAGRTSGSNQGAQWAAEIRAAR